MATKAVFLILWNKEHQNKNKKNRTLLGNKGTRGSVGGSEGEYSLSRQMVLSPYPHPLPTLGGPQDWQRLSYFPIEHPERHRRASRRQRLKNPYPGPAHTWVILGYTPPGYCVYDFLYCVYSGKSKVTFLHCLSIDREDCHRAIFVFFLWPPMTKREMQIKPALTTRQGSIWVVSVLRAQEGLISLLDRVANTLSRTQWTMLSLTALWKLMLWLKYNSHVCLGIRLYAEGLTVLSLFSCGKSAL